MSRVVCVTGPRPAFGKTTTAVNLSLALAMAGKKTLLIDWCPNRDASRQFRMEPMGPEEEVVPEEGWIAGRSTTWDGLHWATRRWDPALVTGIAEWRSEDCQAEGLRWTERIRGSGWDVVLIDCPADGGPFTESAMWASDEILVPLRCECSVLHGVADLVQIVRRVHADPEKSLEFAGVLLTQFHPENGLSEHIEQEVREFFGDIVFETIIPWDATVSEAVWRSQPLLELAPRSRAACAYVELCMEVLGR